MPIRGILQLGLWYILAGPPHHNFNASVSIFSRELLLLISYGGVQFHTILQKYIIFVAANFPFVDLGSVQT